jgi:hypothetical protein
VSDSRLFKTLLTGDRRLFGKLESVRRRQVHNKVTVEAIEAFCVARSIPVGFEDSDLGHRVITVEDSPEWRSRYLSILDDDHLTSELTNAQYQATSKIDWGHS